MTEERNMLPKREAMDSLLTQGDVLVQLDPRVAGVSVPLGYGDQALLVLRIGLEMPIPIPDLEIDEVGIRATLSFDRTPHAVFVPWESVFGLVTEQGQGLLWTTDVPLEILDQMLLASADGADGADEQPVQEPAPARPQLVALDGGLDGNNPPPAPDRGPPTLRVVK